MECSSDKCLKPENDRTVSCWLCLKFYHLKCSSSGVRARDADALADRQKFLQWTCISCRSVGIEFYKFFKNSKEEFDRISTEFLSLQEKFSDFGKLFTDFKKLNERVSSPPTSTIKRSTNKVGNVITQPNLATDSQAKNKINGSSQIVNSLSTIPSTSAVNAVNKATPVVVADHSQFLLNGVAENIIASPVHSIFVSPDKSENGVSPYSSLCVTSDLSQNTILPLPNVPTQTSCYTSPVAPRPLRTVPPYKNVFLSRLSSETTTEDIEYYVKSKLGINSLISAYKFKYSQPRAISSFRITVPDDLFQYTVDPKFWPIGTFVREYIYNGSRQKAVHLPIRDANVLKN